MNTQTFTIPSPVGFWAVTTTETHLTAIDFLGEALPAGYASREPETKLEQRLDCMLSRYFRGERVDFATVPVMLPPTAGPLFQRVMQTLAGIPYGTVQHYQWMAEQTGNILASRAVGGALGRNPIPIVLPCHRIVAKHNRIGGFMRNCPEGGPIKRFLLELEGHRFDAGGRLVTRAPEALATGLA